MLIYDIYIEKKDCGIIIESTQRNKRGVCLCLMHYYEQGDEISITVSNGCDTFEIANSHEDVMEILAERQIHAARAEQSLIL